MSMTQNPGSSAGEFFHRDTQDREGREENRENEVRTTDKEEPAETREEQQETQEISEGEPGELDRSEMDIMEFIEKSDATFVIRETNRESGVQFSSGVDFSFSKSVTGVSSGTKPEIDFVEPPDKEELKQFALYTAISSAALILAGLYAASQGIVSAMGVGIVSVALIFGAIFSSLLYYNL